jgi:hypothetical protein
MTSTVKRFFSRTEVWIVLFITLAALAIRWNMLGQSMAFTYDQGRDMLVWSGITRGDFKLVGPTTGLAGIFLGPFYYYALLPGFLLKGGDPVGVAAWMGALVVTGLPALYWTLKPLVGRWWATVGLVGMALLPGSIHDSRQLWNPSLAAPLLIWTMWAVTYWRRHFFLLPLAAFLFGCLLQTEAAYAFFLIPLFLIWGVRLIKNGEISIRSALMVIMSFGVTLLPQLAFEAKNRGLMTKNLLIHMADDSTRIGWLELWKSRPAQMLSSLDNILFADMQFARFGILALLLCSLLVMWLYRSRSSAWWWTGLSWAPLLGLMLFRGNNGAFFEYYLTSHYLPLIVSGILVLAALPLRRWVTAGFFLFFILLSYYHYLPIITRPEIFQYVLPQQIAAVKEVYRWHQNPGLDLFVPNLQPTQYQYLVEWLKKKGEIPATAAVNVSGEQNIYYLIWEPPFDGASRFEYEAWRKRMTAGAECLPKATFGIIILEECVRPATSLN